MAPPFVVGVRIYGNLKVYWWRAPETFKHPFIRKSESLCFEIYVKTKCYEVACLVENVSIKMIKSPFLFLLFSICKCSTPYIYHEYRISYGNPVGCFFVPESGELYSLGYRCMLSASQILQDPVVLHTLQNLDVS